ncbi:MAG TPA: glycosyltransferase [Candidatus Saccharimonadales bacterium]|nr:glycosyltransferase [Candidatus Saccharimonadales bacterium]
MRANPSTHPRPPIWGAPKLAREWKFAIAFVLATLMVCWVARNLEYQPLSAGWQSFCGWGRFQLGFVNEWSSSLWILTPTMLVIASAGAMLLAFDRPPDWLRLPVGVGFLLLQCGYLAFRLAATLSLDTVPNAAFSILFFLSELFVHLRIALGNLSLLRLTHRSAQADESARIVRAGEYLPTVDVFVPTYSEPVEMLERSIIGCQAMDYPYKTIWLLDDQRRPAMRELARKLGCCYLDRPDNLHAKAGNLNHALARSEGELVLCFDADFIPTRDFLQRTVGFFRDRRVALVQTPQNFFNEDAVQRNLGLEGALEDEQKLFFRTLQPGRDSFNAIVCHGTCWVGRRSALEEIGGIPTETITEDWATSIKLQAAGYQLLYLNEPLSAGLSADTCGEFVQQRSRWAQGTLQALFASTNPLRIPGLTWQQRLLHFSGILYYAGSVSNLFHLLAPLLYLFFGVCILRMSVAEIIFFRLPFTVGYYMLYSWLTLRTRSAVWTEFYDAFLAPSMGLTALRTFCKPFGRGFRVTDKTQRPKRIMINRRVAWPFIVLLLLHVAGLAFAAVTGKAVDQPDVFSIVVYFTASNLVMLWVCLLVSMDIRRARTFPRFTHRLAFELAWDDDVVRGETLYLSESEATIPRLPASAPVPEKAVLCLPELEFVDVPVRLRRDTEGQLSVEFLGLSLSQRRALVQFLYCRPGQWETTPKSEVRAVWEYARAGLRMYPLAESV